MLSQRVSKIGLVIALAMMSVASVHAQPAKKPNKLNYVLTIARKLPPGENPEQNMIEVGFGKSFPAIAVAEKADNWLVRSLDAAGNEREYKPTSVAVFTADLTQNLVRLTMVDKLSPGGELDILTHRITIRFRQANFPDVVLGQSEKKSALSKFVAAKGKPDADIYFSGSAAGARGSKPLYSFESKLGYLWDLERLGSLGLRGTADAASQSNIDPDSITAGATYQKVFVIAPATGIILTSDFIGAEFDTSNRTRNLTSKADGTLVIPSARMGETNFVTADFLVGVEGGHNYRHKLNEEGLGNFWRWKFGATAYFTALNPPGLKRINFTTEYKVRVLQSAEPFIEKINEKDVVSFLKKPRHYVASDMDLMFSKALGITLKYRYGSLPPAFRFIDHSASIGLTFQMKQAH
jgi:hypothetical protein